MRVWILPLWLVIVLGIAGGGLYLGYHTPELVATISVVTVLLFGLWSVLSREVP